MIDNMDNLSPYTIESAGWSDRHSTVTFSWMRPGEPGLQTMVDLFGWMGSEITKDLLSWTLSEGGNDLPLKLESRTYRPDKVIEIDSAGDIQLKMTASYPLRNCLGLEFELTNTSDSARTVDLRFNYHGQDPVWEGLCPISTFMKIDNEPEGSWSILYPFDEHGRKYLWTRGFVAGMVDQTTIEMVCLTDMSRRSFALGPRGSASFTTHMAFGRSRRVAGQNRDEFLAKKAAGWTSEDETPRWQEFLSKLPPLAPKYRGNEKYERIYAHAAAQLSTLYIRGNGGYVGDKHISVCSKRGLAASAFWDNAFTNIGGREVCPELAAQAVECYCDHPSPRGALPGILCDVCRAGEGQAPILSWSAWMVYQRTQDRDWLKRVYPRLVGHDRFWLKYHSSERGLCQYFNAGLIADDDARFDPIQGSGANMDLFGVESPDLNSYLVMEMKCLANMAEELGLKDEAAQWRSQSGELAQKIIDTMYFPEDAMFFDVATGTRDQFTGTKTPNMFLPLWAGVPLPEQEVKKIIERHMLNPDEFYREFPFPSLSYDNPKYDPMGYWRGRIWPHVVYWMIQTLWRHGYRAEAEQTADRLLTLIEREPHINETYESKNGTGVGVSDYNWSLATTIELLLERYKEPLP